MGFPMYDTRRAAGLAAAALVIAGAASLLGGAHPVSGQADPASRALLYLQSQQSATDGSIPSSPGSFGPSELYAIGAAAAGYDPNVLAHGGPSVIDYLAANAASACRLVTDPSAAAGACGELIEAVVAAGRNPVSFAGLDLVSRLSAYWNATTGAFGDGQAFTQALAIQGLVAAAAPVPAGALSFLHHAQDSDGGWDYLDIRDDPNAGTNFDTSDTNSTAMVLMALDAAGDHTRDASALAWLHTQQQPDGGFPYSGSPSDPDSTALVLQAIVATGQDPQGPAWAVAGHTALEDLVATQGSNGGYTFPGNPAPDPFTTSQVPPALERVAFPARVVYAAGFTPATEAHTTLSALLYLQSQQSATDGSIPSSPGSFGPSELYAIGAAAAGYDPNVLAHGGPSVIDYLAANAASACRLVTDPSAAAGACGELIEAVVAAGRNPVSFAGLDLVSRLSAYWNATTGAFGDGQAFTQALAIQGLVAAAAPVPAGALSFLHHAQDSDGGWDYLDIRDDPNAGTNFDTSDTNSTAMVLMALDAAGDHTRDASALAWLHTQQQPDGGFPYSGSPSDPDSTALVLQAIVATGQDPQGPAWAVAGHTALEDLVATQGSNGGYTFPGNPAPDPFTTSQVPPALERVAFPVPFGQHAFYIAGATLSGNGPPPAPSPRPSPVPAGVVTPPASVPTPAARGGVTVPTVAPTSAATPSPSAPPSATSSPSGAFGATAPPTHSQPGIVGSAPGGLPAPVVYLLVALAAAVVIGGGSALVAARR
jgi:sugar phosphate isomerase/epimerase